jgi:hypothetical protein
MGATGIPTLSQIRSWDTQHLEAAADHWEARAQNWQDAFTAVYKQVPAPGGVPWEGRAADAALLHVGGDRLQAVGAADTLYGSAATARAGAYQIESAKQTTVQAVQAAQDQGFVVGEDLSVVDRSPQPSAILVAQRQAQAQAHSAAIRGAAADLASTDAAVAGQVTTAAAGLKEAQFKSGGGGIQMVDNTTGPKPPTPTPGAQPQIGPFPVPPGIGDNLPPPQATVPKDPTGGLLTPQNLPPAPPPPNIPGVKPAPPQGQPPMMGPPPTAPLPSYPDLVNQVRQQQQQLDQQAAAAGRPTPGGLGAAVVGGCTSTGIIAGIAGAETGPVDGPIAIGGCVLGGLGGLGTYLTGLWANNAFGGAG